MLTPKEHKTYQYIRRYLLVTGHAPTVQEIAAGIGIRSRGTIHRYVQALKQKGYISGIPHKKRSLMLVPGKKVYGGLPVIGHIAAGKPIKPILEDEILNVSDLLADPANCALKVGEHQLGTSWGV